MFARPHCPNRGSFPFLGFLAGWLLVGFLAAPVTAQAPFREPAFPSLRQLDRFGLKQLWWGQAELNPRRDHVTHLVVDEDNVYVQTSSSIITCFNAETGKQLWSTSLGRGDEPNERAISNQSVVLIATAARMYCLDKFTGQMLWQIRTPGVTAVSPEIDSERVYIGTEAGKVYAFSLAKIRNLYNEGLLPEWSYQTRVWTYAASDQIATPPISVQNRLMFATRDGDVHAIETASRKDLFRIRMKTKLSAPIEVADGQAYIATEKFYFYALNIVTGAIQWDYVFSLPVKKSPVVINDTIYITPEGGGILALSTLSGEKRWTREGIDGFLASMSQFVLVSDTANNVVLLDRGTGGYIGQLPLKNYTVRPANNRTDRLYMATSTGRVLCLSEASQEFPRFYANPGRRPILPEVPRQKPNPNANYENNP